MFEHTHTLMQMQMRMRGLLVCSYVFRREMLDSLVTGELRAVYVRVYVCMYVHCVYVCVLLCLG